MKSFFIAHKARHRETTLLSITKYSKDYLVTPAIYWVE
ncbi:MAG: hypothetical protein ACI9A2_000324, partial [Halioglobus sp.]